jgi:hypothetical protein
MKIRFEKTQYGWRAYARKGNAFIYFGHFRTQRDAQRALAQGV